jgi:hypothetical protein
LDFAGILYDVIKIEGFEWASRAGREGGSPDLLTEEVDPPGGKKYHRVERAYGSFIRSFTIPEDGDASNVSAEFKEGVLRVHLAKSEQAKPKTIEVKVG